MRLDREQTKSESPELGASVHEVPLTDPILASGEQHSISTKSPEPSTIPFIFNSASQPVSIQHIVEEYVKKHGLSSIKQTGEKAVDIDRTPKRKSSTADPVRAQNVRSNSRPLRNSDPIFDPIESDTESFHEKQKMQSAKRLRSTRTTSPRALNKIRADPSNGQFLVPSIPQSRTNRARISSTQVISPGQGEKIPKSRREPKDGIMGDQKDPKRHRKHDAESPEHAESESCEDGRINIDQETSNKNTVNNDLADAAQTSSQATTAWSQDSNNSVNGTGGLAVQRSSTPVTSQEQEPDEITRLGHDANGVFCNSGDNRVAQEAGRLAKEAEEQQEKKKIREKQAEEKEAVEKENAARKKGAEREANERRLADQKDAKEKQARAEQFAQAKRANAREEELAEAKRIEEKVVNAARLAEEQKVSESLARERQTRETTLVEEAKKMLLASDGAKQIEAEKKEKENSRRKELAAKKQADEAKAEKQAREEQGKNSGKKAREEQLARGKAQRSANIESKDAKQRTHQAGTSQETETTLKEHVRKLRDSEVQNRASTTPSVPLDVAGPKRSMTPVIPGSSVTKSSSYQNSVRSSPQSNRSSGSMNAPLRSALRQTPSALRRSGSSVSFDVLPRSILKKYTPSTPNLKSLEDMDNEPATKSSSATHLPKTSSKTVSNAPLKTPTKILVPKKAPDGKITKTPAKNGKVQTKLNVTREVKKLKGRAVNPPVTSTLAPKQEIVLSSGEDSSTSEEPKWQTGNAKAGPSSKKPTFSATSSQGKKTAQVKSLDAPIDPVIRNIKVERDRTAAPATLPRSTSTSDAASLQRSASRSPALALSETHSFSSGSVSSLASGSDSEMESDSGNIQAPSSKTPTGTKNGKLAPVTMEGPSKTVNVGVKKPEGYFENKASSQSNQASSSRSRSTASIHDHGKHVDQAADQQLQLESRQSLPSSRIKQAASSTTSDTAGNKLINQGLDHAGRLPNGTRPAYYQFPCLAELQKIPRAVTPVAKPKPDTSSSHALGALPAEYSGSDGSSSSSDDSSSDSNENEDVDKLTSQTSFRKKSGRFPGMRGVMKRRLSRPLSV